MLPGIGGEPNLLLGPLQCGPVRGLGLLGHMLMSWETFAARATNPRFSTRPTFPFRGQNCILMVSEEPDGMRLPDIRNRVRPEVGNYPGISCEGSHSKKKKKINGFVTTMAGLPVATS